MLSHNLLFRHDNLLFLTLSPLGYDPFIFKMNRHFDYGHGRLGETWNQWAIMYWGEEGGKDGAWAKWSNKKQCASVRELAVSDQCQSNCHREEAGSKWGWMLDLPGKPDSLKTRVDVYVLCLKYDIDLCNVKGVLVWWKREKLEERAMRLRCILATVRSQYYFEWDNSRVIIKGCICWQSEMFSRFLNSRPKLNLNLNCENMMWSSHLEILLNT